MNKPRIINSGWEELGLDEVKKRGVAVSVIKADYPKNLDLAINKELENIGGGGAWPNAVIDDIKFSTAGNEESGFLYAALIQFTYDLS